MTMAVPCLDFFPRPLELLATESSMESTKTLELGTLVFLLVRMFMPINKARRGLTQAHYFLRHRKQCTSSSTLLFHPPNPSHRGLGLLGPPEVHHDHPSTSVDHHLTIKDPFMDLLLSGSFDKQKFMPPIPYSERQQFQFPHPCIDLYQWGNDQQSLNTLKFLLEKSWNHNSLTTLKIICFLRKKIPPRKDGKEKFFASLLWLYKCHPKSLAYNLEVFAKFGYLKDLLEILYRLLYGYEIRKYEFFERREIITMKNYKKAKLKYSKIIEEPPGEKQMTMRLRDQKRILMAKKAIEKYNNDEDYSFLYEHISDIFARLLKSDLEFLNTGQIDKISLAAKWCPSLDSSYDRSTLFCESVARKLFPYDSDAEYREIEEAHYVYRVRERLRKQVLIPLRKALELPETYMSRREWRRLPYDRVPSVAMKTYKKLFFKHDDWRIRSHLRYLKRSVKPKFNFSRLLPHEILSLLNYAFGEEIAEYHWRRVVEDFSSKGCFHNCISIFSSAPWYNFSNFCYAFSLLTSEFCESPWKGKMAVRNASFDVDFIKIEGEDLRSKLKTLKSHDCICVTVSEILDKVINMALECNLSTDKMIKKIFIFGNTVLSLQETNESESMRKKFEMNGYVIPHIVCWDLKFCWIPSVKSADDMTFIYGCSNDIFRVFLEGDGNLDPVAIMDVELSGEEYNKLVVHD
ncbi:hypothetical protein SO802_014052 [Lithocarpus litseifolius]|uniref:Uncharacterized protein n=1 Tax=Lithocarpus litseifolius TaxID=425828 RepID=A0AAW2D808_9ROSI